MSHQQDTIYLRGGKVTLYRRDDTRSEFWQYRFKLDGEKRYRRCSAKTTVRRDAERIAEDHYDELRYKVKFGLPTSTALFATVVENLENELEALTDAGRIAPTRLKFMKGTLRRYCVPFFGQMKISEINDSHILQYQTWRLTAGRKPPAGNTTRFEESVLRRVFKHAVKMNILKREDIPEINSDPLTAKSRPAFTWTEYKELLQAAEEYAREAKHPRIARDRWRLRWYIQFMVQSGLRIGEARYLKWRDIAIRPNSELPLGQSIRLQVKGKSGKRPAVVPMQYIFHTIPKLARLQRLNTSKVIGKDEGYVFARPDGSPVHTFEVGFRALLKRANLMYDTYGERRTIYSLRHSFAMFQLVREKVSIYNLAINMGTSVEMIRKHYGSHIDAEHYEMEMSQARG